MEEQTSSLEEIASSMEKMAFVMHQNADSMRQVSQLTDSASEVASQGGAVVTDVVATTHKINASLRAVPEIVGVADGIAFQTNIPVLNAAVEAARAGEQDRSFAVVAGKVCNLAQRNTTAAKKIREMIEASLSEVETGSALTKRAGDAMKDIMSSVRRVTDVMGEIAAVSNGQNSSIEQINRAVTFMDKTTQQNTVLVEQAVTTAESLEERAQALSAAIAAFRLA